MNRSPEEQVRAAGDPEGASFANRGDSLSRINPLLATSENNGPFKFDPTERVECHSWRGHRSSNRVVMPNLSPKKLWATSTNIRARFYSGYYSAFDRRKFRGSAWKGRVVDRIGISSGRARGSELHSSAPYHGENRAHHELEAALVSLRPISNRVRLITTAERYRARRQPRPRSL